MPLISVIVPTCNRPQMLAEALASVRAQTFTDYEIIVVSNNETAAVRHNSRGVAAVHDCRFFTLEQGNISAARNFGIVRGNGEWIAFLDDDDLWLPNKLRRQLDEARRTSADMIACDYIEFYTDAKTCPPEIILQPGQNSRDKVEIHDGLEHSGREFIRRPRFISKEWPTVKTINHLNWWALPSGVIVRRSTIDAVGGFDPRQRYCEDNDLWRRISWRHHIYQLDEVLLRYRRGHASALKRERLRYIYEIRYFFKMQFDTPSDLRSTIPPARDFLANRILIIVLPSWLRRKLEVEPWTGPQWRRLCPWLRPRTRWNQFRQWLRPQTR